MAATIEEQVVEVLRSLPAEKKQEVLDFVRFLSLGSPTAGTVRSEGGVSALDLAQRWVGCVEDAPEDLSTNKAYMEGYGG